MRTVTIDRGQRDGVLADMAVIAPAGVVGRVIGSPAAHAARVQLLIDRNAAAGALTERTRAGGMVVGVDADPPLRMELVSNLADVKAGDSGGVGIDGIYPKGYTIGRVERVGPRAPGCTVQSRCVRRWISRAWRKCSSCSCRRARRPASEGGEVKTPVVAAGDRGAMVLQTTLSGLWWGARWR